MAIATELITKFSFQGSSSPLNQYNASLVKGIGLVAGFATASIAASIAIGKWASNVLQSIQPLGDLAAQTGVAVEAIQELGYVASVSNSSAGALQSTLSGLSQKIGDAAQKGSAEFARLGISVRDSNGHVKTADKILGEVGSRFRQLNLSLSEQRSFASSLGIDASLITMLNKTSSEISGLRDKAREMGVLTGEQTGQALAYNDAMTTLKFGLDSVRRLIAVGLAPSMVELTEKFTDLIAKNKDWIINAAKSTIEVIGDIIDALVRMAPFIGAAVVGFVAFKVATLGLAGALSFLSIPAILIAALVVALFLAVEDLVVAFQGGQSVIRNFWLEFAGVDILPILRAIVKFIKLDFAGAWEDIKSSFIIMAFKLGEKFREIFAAIFDWMKLELINILPDWAKNLMMKDQPTTETTGVMPDSSVARPHARLSELGSVNRTEVNVQQNIRTSDPERAGQVAADSLQRQMEDAQTQSRRGGM